MNLTRCGSQGVVVCLLVGSLGPFAQHANSQKIIKIEQNFVSLNLGPLLEIAVDEKATITIHMASATKGQLLNFLTHHKEGLERARIISHAAFSSISMIGSTFSIREI
jgi:hypothetical protein